MQTAKAVCDPEIRSRDHDSLVTPLSHEPLMYYLRFKERKEGKGRRTTQKYSYKLISFLYRRQK